MVQKYHQCLESHISWSDKMVQTNAERCAKYRTDNKEKFQLVAAMQQFKRSKELASGTPVSEKMRKAAALRKRVQRMREKESSGRIVTRGAERGNENEGDNCCLFQHHENQHHLHRHQLSHYHVHHVQSLSGGQEIVFEVRSRQRLVGEKVRRAEKVRKSKSMAETVKENEDLKKAADKHDDELAEMDFQLNEMRQKLEKAVTRIKELETERENEYIENNDWVPKVYKNMSIEGRKEFKNAFLVASDTFKKGTISRLRRTTKLNFSKIPTNSAESESDLKKKINSFALENTLDVPDKKKYMAGARFRTSSMLSLFSTFETMFPGLCTYGTFNKYWPAEYVKPCASDFGTCLCMPCQNIELKAEALVSRKLLGKDQPGFDIETVIKESRLDNFEPENDFKSELNSLSDSSTAVGYLEWTKVKQTEINVNTGKPKSDKTMRLSKNLPAAGLAKQLMTDYDEYKNHLERDFVMKTELKKVRQECKEYDDLACLHVDWAEKHELTEVREIQTAYFNGRYSYDLHTGYCYTKEDSHGFVSLTDSSDHTASAVHNALRPKIEALVAKGKTRFVICSDSPSSQYRNSKNVFLMRRFCAEYGISIRLLYTEAGHGKSACDGVGGNVKTQVEAVALPVHGNSEMLTIHSADDVAKVIKDKTNLTYDVTVHYKEKTEEINRSMGKLSSLTGAMQIHEVMIGSDLSIKKKNLPTDPFFKSVEIKESRRKSSVVPSLDVNME